MGCDCQVRKGRTFMKVDPATGNVIWLVDIAFSSQCNPVEEPEEPKPIFHGPETHSGAEQSPERVHVTDESIQHQSAAARLLRLPSVCLNTVSVGLGLRTSLELSISEVTLGDDIFQAGIKPGDTQNFDEVCAVDCELKPARAKIVNEYGDLIADVGGFKVCRCKQW
jgi:hypothetical protein